MPNNIYEIDELVKIIAKLPGLGLPSSFVTFWFYNDGRAKAVGE